MWEAHDDAIREAMGEPIAALGSRKKILIYSAGCRLCQEAGSGASWGSTTKSRCF
jgi:hypothetical protein